MRTSPESDKTFGWWLATTRKRMRTRPDRDELEEHVRDEQSTFSWLLEPMMQRAGFAIEAADYSDDGIFAKYVLRRH